MSAVTKSSFSSLKTLPTWTDCQDTSSTLVSRERGVEEEGERKRREGRERRRERRGGEGERVQSE